MDVAQLVEPRVVIPVVVGSSPIVHPRLRQQAKTPRPLPAADEVMSAKIGVVRFWAVDGVMSAKIAEGDFGQ